MEHWLADSTTIHNWYFFPNASISYNFIVKYVSFVIYIFNRKKVLANTL